MVDDYDKKTKAIEEEKKQGENKKAKKTSFFAKIFTRNKKDEIKNTKVIE